MSSWGMSCGTVDNFAAGVFHAGVNWNGANWCLDVVATAEPRRGLHLSRAGLSVRVRDRVISAMLSRLALNPNAALSSGTSSATESAKAFMTPRIS